MERAQVRIVEQPQVSDAEATVSQSEADYLLAKYGFRSTPQHHPSPAAPATPQDHRTFDQMVREQQARTEAERARRDRPRAVTFNDSSVMHSETRWTSLDDAPGMGVQVTIVTDMKF